MSLETQQIKMLSLALLIGYMGSEIAYTARALF